MQETLPKDRHGLLFLVNTWLLCGILLMLASTYGFSFESGGANTVIGSRVAVISGGDSQATLLLRLQTYGIYALCALLIVPLIKIIGSECRRNILILSLLLWAIMSIAWSIDYRRSMVSVVEMTMDIAFAIYLIRRYSINDLLKLLMLVGSVAAASSLFLILVFPQYGLQQRDLLYAFGAWQGIFGQKNLCGMMMTLLLLPAFFVQLDSHLARIYRGIYIVVLGTIIAMTQSVGSWTVCGLCVTFIVVIRLMVKFKRKDAWCIGMVLVGVLVVAIPIIVHFGDTLLRMVGKDPTMTGRTRLWASLLVSILKHPLVGYGYRAFWQGLSGESAYATLKLNSLGRVGYAENGVLELWLDLGAVGVLLYALVFFGGVRNAIYCFRHEPSPAILWCISVLSFVALMNIGGGILLSPFNLICILPFVAYFALGREARRISEAQDRIGLLTLCTCQLPYPVTARWTAIVPVDRPG